ncbi:MAG: GIY-YIG nuclease family protein [Ferruginibacter sp.]|nr:GIY-YIG nuclease family protein [Ferruginibacter sp.]
MYAIVDIETTGGYASANGITEIAVYIHDGTRVIKKFETLINPLQKIPNYITALTGIDNAMVANAPTFSDIAETLFKLLNDKIFIAHSVNFDYSFVKHQLKNFDFDLAVKKLCTVRLGRKVFPGLPSYSLGNLCRELKIPIDNRHRAGGDAKATVLLFEKYLQHNAQEHIDAMLKKSSAEQWLPMHLTKEDVKRLPNTPGVYYFHDAKNKIVYVGKAINIKKRVSSHFTHNAPDRKRQNFLRNIHAITYKECATELEALVLESTEIKRFWPKYNASQKQPQQRFGLYSFEDGKGYIRLAIDKRKKHLPALYTFNLLHEGLVMLKKMIEEYALSDKLCFVNKQPLTEEENIALETPKKYNKKINKAIEALNMQLPTFAVVDDGKAPYEKLCLLIEKGNFWGMGYVTNHKILPPINELKEILTPYADNDYIRNSIYSFVESNPHKKIELLV